MQDEMIFNEEVQTLEDSTEETEQDLHPLVAEVSRRFNLSKDNRRTPETRWQKNWLNFRGHYTQREAFTATERSDIFIKITKSKVMTAAGQIMEILMSDGSFPLAIQPTPDPVGTVNSAYIDSQNPTEQESDIDDETLGILDRAVSSFKRRLKGAKASPGKGVLPTEYNINPAEEAARYYNRLILDQLEESDISVHLKSAVLDAVLFGTGILKGPFIEEKEYPRWTQDGYDPIFKIMPKCERVSPWDFYPDPEASSMADAEWVIERHRWSKEKLLSTRHKPQFRPNKVLQAVKRGYRYYQEYWEDTTRSDDTTSRPGDERYEVHEMWGAVDGRLIEGIEGFKKPDGFDPDLQYHINVFVCNNIVIRLVLNPFKPSRLPYHVAPYEEDVFNFFGVGLPENMEDCQTMMNGTIRMAVDNTLLSGNVILEVDEDALVSGQSLDLHVGKVFRKASGSTGQSIYPINIPNVAGQSINMFNTFRQLADEATGIATLGQSPQGAGRTASGISMVLGGASLPIKNVIRNIDTYFIKSLGEAFFAFNLQFNRKEGEDIPTDLEVKATGVASLLTKESKLQKLLQFDQIGRGNPRYNDGYVIREIAKELSLDPDKVVNSLEEAQVKMALMGGGQQQPGQEGVSQPSQAQGPLSVSDEVGSGGGQPSIGVPPAPGTDQFSGNQ